jgi:acetyl-CoA acyltransferase
MTEVVIVSAVRSAVGRGKADGSLAGVHPVDLSSTVMKEAIARAGIDAAIIEDVQWGCAMPEASQGLNHARLAWLRGGLPVETSAATVNRFCSSGLQSVAYAAQAIIAGMGDTVMAGGIEMMSQVPMSGYNARLSPEITESYIGMGFTAERVAKRWGITREQQDQFAFDSQQKAAVAVANKVFAPEIVPIIVKQYAWTGAAKVTWSSTPTSVRAPPRWKDSPNCGRRSCQPAAYWPTTPVRTPMARRCAGDERRIPAATPACTVRQLATGGVDPDIMGVGPIKAVPKALARAGLALSDLKLIEFSGVRRANQAVIKELGWTPASSM